MYLLVISVTYFSNNSSFRILRSARRKAKPTDKGTFDHRMTLIDVNAWLRNDKGTVTELHVDCVNADMCA